MKNTGENGYELYQEIKDELVIYKISDPNEIFRQCMWNATIRKLLIFPLRKMSSFLLVEKYPKSFESLILRLYLSE